MSTTDPKEGRSSGAYEMDGQRVGSGPMAILLPPDEVVWHEARKLIVDKNARVEDLAVCASQDPVIVLELLKTANALFFSGGRHAIVSARNAIVRLGSDVVLDCLATLDERKKIEDEDIRYWVEAHRSRCRRTGILARMLAEISAKTLADECHTAALLLHVGEMLAVMHLGTGYVKLAEELSRSGVLYRLANDHRFDVEQVGLTYLTRSGIPQLLLFAIDRNATSKSPDKTVMKPVVSGASELVEAFDSNRWEKLAPGRTLPPKSALRLLGLQESQYLKLYERASQYLYSERDEEARRKQKEVALLSADTAAATPVVVETPSAPPAQPPSFQSEIELLMAAAAAHQEEVIPEVEEKADEFSLKKEKKPSIAPRVDAPRTISVPESKHAGASTKINTIVTALEGATSSEELLSSLLDLLVTPGPFQKSALIVISHDKKNAIVVAARGPQIGNGQRLVLEDPLSPLAQCFSKVQSFGSVMSTTSPFGSRSFAVAPIDADHDTPVALYADCGNNSTITFEARRVFRTVVDVLNQKLPLLPGGIPVELDETSARD